MDLYEIMELLTVVDEKTESALLSFQDFENQFLAKNNFDELYPIHIGKMIFESQQKDLKKAMNGLDRCILDLRKQGYLKEETE